MNSSAFPPALINGTRSIHSIWRAAFTVAVQPAGLFSVTLQGEPRWAPWLSSYTNPPTNPPRSWRRDLSKTGGWQTFPLKGYVVNILSFMGHIYDDSLSLPLSTKAATDNIQMKELSCVIIRLYLQDQAVGQIEPIDLHNVWPYLKCFRCALTS